MMSSLLVAMLVAASVPVTAAERERSGANQRQQPQQQRIQQGAQQGNSARGDARQFQGQARDAGREQHASRSGDRSTPAERQHVQRDHERQSRDVHRERNDGQRRFGHDGPRDHAGSRPNRGGQGNHYGWQGGNSGGQGNHYGWQGNHNGGQGSTRAFDRRYDNAQQDQRQSIQRGIRSGELTRQEASRLMTEQRRLEAQERRYLADGSLSRRERADMTQDLNRARQHIYNETHDAQERR
jgi:hypothetical protein